MSEQTEGCSRSDSSSGSMSSSSYASSPYNKLESDDVVFTNPNVEHTDDNLHLIDSYSQNLILSQGVSEPEFDTSYSSTLDSDDNDIPRGDIHLLYERDYASILDDAAKYIKSLKHQIEFWEKMTLASPFNMKMKANSRLIIHVMCLKHYIERYQAAIGPSHWNKPAIQAYCLVYTLPDIEPWNWFKKQCYQELEYYRPSEPKSDFYENIQWPRTYASMALICCEFEFHHIHIPSLRFPNNLPSQNEQGSANRDKGDQEYQGT